MTACGDSSGDCMCVVEPRLAGTLPECISRSSGFPPGPITWLLCGPKHRSVLRFKVEFQRFLMALSVLLWRCQSVVCRYNDHSDKIPVPASKAEALTSKNFKAVTVVCAQRHGWWHIKLDKRSVLLVVFSSTVVLPAREELGN